MGQFGERCESEVQAKGCVSVSLCVCGASALGCLEPFRWGSWAKPLC